MSEDPSAAPAPAAPPPPPPEAAEGTAGIGTAAATSPAAEEAPAALTAPPSSSAGIEAASGRGASSPSSSPSLGGEGTEDLLGLLESGGGGASAAVPSSSPPPPAPAAIVAGTSAAAPEEEASAPPVPVGGDAPSSAEDHEDVATEESGSSSSSEEGETEESGSSGESDSESEGDDDSSSSSEDPSVVGKLGDDDDEDSDDDSDDDDDDDDDNDLKSPPETTATAAVVPDARPLPPPAVAKSESDRSLEAGVLTKEQVLGPPPPASGEGIKDEHEAAEEGEAFYGAYGAVATIVASDRAARLMAEAGLAAGGGGGGGAAAPAGSRSRASVDATASTTKRMGRDRASLRGTVANRLKGKGYGRSRGRGRRKSSARRSRRTSAMHPGEGGTSGGLDGWDAPSGGGGGRGRRRRRRAGPSATGWSDPRRRRVLYAVVAAAVGVAGIALIAYGATKERNYNRSDEDDDYSDFIFDGMEDEGAGEGDAHVDKSPIHAMPSEPRPAGAGVQSPPPVTFDAPPPPPAPLPAPYPTYPPHLEGVLTARPATASPVYGADDALLTFLKKSYGDELGRGEEGYADDADADAVKSDLDDVAADELHHATQSSLAPEERSAQWRAYLRMSNRRSDAFEAMGIIDATTNELLMDPDRIVQIYALLVFYETFGIVPEGTNECAWPGVSCRGVGYNEHSSVVDEDDLRVVKLDLRGEPRRGTGSDGTPIGPYGPLLRGELPLELAFLRHLEALDVSHNAIGGELRGEMFRWKNAKVVALDDNRLEGSIPFELGMMFHLQKLTLHHNEFTGAVPQQLCDVRAKASNLHFLWVDCAPMPATNAPKVECPEDCCTICFEGYDEDGGPGTGGTSPAPGDGTDTPHSVQSDDLSELKGRLSAESSDKGAALLDVDSPQFHAYAWLAEDSLAYNAAAGGGDDGRYPTRRLLRRYALATLYFATNGHAWSKNDGWLANADECDWFGVLGCDGADDDEEDVVGIALKGNRLEGTIPPELFEFIPDVVMLNLASNDLVGAIPTEIGLLKKIDILELAENELTGDIPTEMGNLNTLNHLFLQSNDFRPQQMMPDEVCRLRDFGRPLTLLWADCRTGSGGSDPDILCSSHCCTTCFSGDYAPPSEAGGDDGDGSGGYVPGGDQGDWGQDVFGWTPPPVPPGGTHSDEATTHGDQDKEVLAVLKKDAPDGGITLDDSLSPQFKAYNWLVGSEPFFIDLNEVSVRITLLQRYALATLYFSTAGHGWTMKDGWLTDTDVCLWEGLTKVCDGATGIRELHLSDNNLVGRIPVEISHLRTLELIDFSDNELNGPIPTEFGQIDDLEILRLGGNVLTGIIPTQLGHLKGLHELYVHFNDMTGQVPAEVCALRSDEKTGLTTLWADCLGEWSKVWCPDQCCDQCFGDESDFIPYGGYIDAETGFPKEHTVPPVAAAVIPGRTFLPTASPVASEPTYASLAENEALKTDLISRMTGFEGRLSDPDSDAYKAYLWLANAPDFAELGEFRKLQRFGLSTFYLSTQSQLGWKVSNNWQTTEHECNWFGISCAQEDTVTEISLPSNRLSGTIPPEIGLAGLGGEIGKLNLSGNNIGGKLAEQLGTLKHLEVLDLRSNDFTGKIPATLGQLSRLTSLQIQANELSGVMPRSICSLVAAGDVEVVADCDVDDPFSRVECELGTCCSQCY